MYVPVLTESMLYFWNQISTYSEKIYKITIFSAKNIML